MTMRRYNSMLSVAIAFAVLICAVGAASKYRGFEATADGRHAFLYATTGASVGLHIDERQGWIGVTVRRSNQDPLPMVAVSVPTEDGPDRNAVLQIADRHGNAWHIDLVKLAQSHGTQIRWEGGR